MPNSKSDKPTVKKTVTKKVAPKKTVAKKAVKKKTVAKRPSSKTWVNQTKYELFEETKKE